MSGATHVPQTKKGIQVLLMTCRAKITGPDGSITHAKAFLDLGASCSFVTERLAQLLKLPRRRDNSVIDGIAGVNATRTRGAVIFTVSHMSGKGRQVYVENAFVLSKVCMDMPVSPVDSLSQWKHLTGLDIADPDFGTPAHRRAPRSQLFRRNTPSQPAVGPTRHTLCADDVLWMGPGWTTPI